MLQCAPKPRFSRDRLEHRHIAAVPAGEVRDQHRQYRLDIDIGAANDVAVLRMWFAEVFQPPQPDAAAGDHQRPNGYQLGSAPRRADMRHRATRPAELVNPATAPGKRLEVGQAADAELLDLKPLFGNRIDFSNTAQGSADQ